MLWAYGRRQRDTRGTQEGPRASSMLRRPRAVEGSGAVQWCRHVWQWMGRRPEEKGDRVRASACGKGKAGVSVRGYNAGVCCVF